jgi:hypothetical protein
MIRFFWRFLRESEKTRANVKESIQTRYESQTNMREKNNEPFKPKFGEKALKNSGGTDPEPDGTGSGSFGHF